MRPTIDELMEEIQVSDDRESALAAGNTNFPEGWLGVSDASGGYIAYFANEADAFGFRLWLINARLNGRESAQRYELDDVIEEDLNDDPNSG